MQVKTAVQKGLSGVFVIVAANASYAQEPGYVFTADKATPITVHQATLLGQQGGREFKLVIELGDSGAKALQAYSGSRNLGLAQVPKEIKDLDVGSVRLGSYRAGSLQAKFRFGEARPKCFSNDDGRDTLTVSFTEKKPAVVSVTSFEGCENELGQNSGQ